MMRSLLTIGIGNFMLFYSIFIILVGCSRSTGQLVIDFCGCTDDFIEKLFKHLSLKSVVKHSTNKKTLF